jgi:hypothetical protein
MGLLATLGLKGKGASALDVPDLAVQRDDTPTVGQPAAKPPAESPGAVPSALKVPDPAVQAGTASAPPDKNQSAYATARAALQKLLDGLNAHPQKAKVAAAIAAIGAKLGEADGHATKKEWTEATKALGEAKAQCTAAKQLADQWVTYAAQRGDALALGMSLNSSDTPALMPAVQATLAKADGFANATPPDFANAAKTLKEKLSDVLKPNVASIVTKVKTKLGTLEKQDKSIKDFAKDELAQSRTLVVNADAALKASQWSACVLNAIAALRVLGPAVRMCEGRSLYEKQRAATVADVAAVKGSPAVSAQAAGLEAAISQADLQGGYEKRQFEAGVAALQVTSARAKAWKELAGTVGAYALERPAAQALLDALDKHAAAPKVTKERDAIRTLMSQAQALADGAAAQADPTAAWKAALATVQRAKADAEVAKRLVDGLGTAVAAEAAATKTGDAAAMKAALDRLKADGQAAAKAPHADAAAAEFKRFDEQAAAAAQALAAKDGAKAGAALAAAAQALVAAKSIQAEHAQFVANLAAAEAQLKKLQASPRAAAIKARIDPVANGVSVAKAKDQAHDGPAAMAALRQAQDAIAAATAADRDRAAFDTRAAALDKRVAAVTDATEKTALEKMLADARKAADTLAFGDAAKALQKAEVQLDKAALQAAMTANPADPQISRTAAKMVENGGADVVDQMIQAVPNGGDARLVNALAKGRYGVEFKTGAPLPGGDEAKSMKAVCAMFATIPQDVVKNRSITEVSHKDAVGSVGGGHSFDDAKISMSGRPGASAQKFGAAQTNPDPVTGAQVPQLPAAIDENCKPANTTPVDFLAFAAAHEVGHGVDDARGFMAQHGKDPKYGGWISYTSDLKPLADIVGADGRFKAFYKTAEQQQYVLDTLMSKPSNPPATTAGSAEDTARKAFDVWYAKATAKNVYRRQGDCDAIKIGDRVYHEAYVRNWVSYLAAARNKALTGYQFRAPAEWFAELYAGYRSGKLKPDHPAMEWLTKL